MGIGNTAAASCLIAALCGISPDEAVGRGTGVNDTVLAQKTEVVTEAIDVIGDGKPKMLEFGVADETAWKVGLSCGGRIRVFVEKVD